MKVSVIVVAFNKPEFIKLQYDLLSKYMSDVFEFYVYNNSNNPITSKNIEEECNRYGIEYISVPQSIFNSSDVSYRAGKSLDYAIHHNMNTYTDSTHLMILDSDMFLIKPFSMVEYMGHFDLMGIYQQRGHVFYYTNQLMFVDNCKVKNFDTETKFLPGIIDGQATDCGGYLYTYINRYGILHGNVRDNVHSGTLKSEDIPNIDIEFAPYFQTEIEMMNGTNFAEYYCGSFLHFRAGSNWINFNKNVVDNREKLLVEYLRTKLFKNIGI
jgi:hypothetical protein